MCVAYSLSCYAQDSIMIPPADSSALISKDSIGTKNNIYTKIYKAAQKREWTKRLHDLLFDYKAPEGNKKIIENESIENEFLKYSGRPIRNIDIINLSPFGTDINKPDTIWAKSFSNALNSIHKNTLKFIIGNNLFFKKGDPINPQTIAESEIYLRELNYINDARIRLTECPGSDSVDITVITRDKFSLGFNIRNVSFSRYDFEIYDRNILGLGTELNLRYMNNGDKEPPIGYGIGLVNNNLFHTFIRSEISYLKTFDTKNFKVSAERPIHQSLKYLGKVSYSQEKAPYVINLSNDTISAYNEYFTVALGRMFSLNNDNKFFVAGSFLWQNNLSEYKANPDYKYLYYPFERRHLGLFSVSLFQQKFYRSSMIYNFGVTEDIAYGYNITLQTGYEGHNYFDRVYGSINLSKGKHFKIGYLYTKASFGSYFRNGKSEQGLFRLFSSYYSPLINLRGTGYFRQFASIDYTEGIRRLNAAKEYLYFSTLTNFNTSKYNLQANGIRRFVINTESNWFSPLTVLGFRTVLFSFINIAWLGHKNETLFKKDNFFSGIGIGIRTRNDQLVFKTIQIKLAWYPQLDQRKFTDYYNFSSSNPNASPNFRPEYPNTIPFE